MSEGLGLKGEFKLLHKIGEGGMADVFLAERMGDDGFRTRVALKRLHRGLAMDNYFIRQLVREARLLGQLEHANIVKVYDLRHIGDEYYVVMEYVDGIDLAAVARVHRRRKTRIPRPFFFHVALSLTEALAYAHSAVDPEGKATPLIHRDLKPSNVMLSRRGVVKLTDFGIAHVGDGSVTGGLVQGTANYMSPEQAFGEERLTPASDVYSLGSVFYEMLTGDGLVDGDNYLKAIHQVRNRRVTVDELAEAGVEPGLRMVIAKMLAADIKDRYQEMDSVRNDLQFVSDRLKVDLSWHRIRSYVGRLMGILGRAPDRATLSNLKVASEYSPVATNLAEVAQVQPEETPVASSPEPPVSPVPDAPALAVKDGGMVTQAVEKDLLEVALGSSAMDAGEALVIGGPDDDEEDTVGGDTDSDAPRPLDEEVSDESTAVASSASWALGGDSKADEQPPDFDLATTPSLSSSRSSSAPPAKVESLPSDDAERPSSWSLNDDDEATRVYDGQSPREIGVVGSLGMDPTPPPAPRLNTDAVQQLGQTADSSGAQAEVSSPPPGRPATDGGKSSNDMWVFSESNSSLSLRADDSMATAARSPAFVSGPRTGVEPPSARRRKAGKGRRRTKRNATARILQAMFLVFFLILFGMLLLIMRAKGLPPFSPKVGPAEVPSTSEPVAPAVNVGSEAEEAPTQIRGADPDTSEVN